MTPLERKPTGIDRHEHLRWIRRDTKEKSSWKETLLAMCDYYGTFCGRWHSNDFWKQTRAEVPDMTEDECKQKIIDIENEADADLAYWQAMQ